MAPALQASYGDYVTDAAGHAVAGAAVTLYPVDAFPAGTIPTDIPAVTPLAAATTDAAGRFLFKGIPPGDYHVLAQYTPPGGTATTAWRYNVAVAPYEGARRTAAHLAGAATPRTLAKLLGGLPVTLLCVGDEVTVGYNATGTVAGGWVARLAARLAAAVPTARVARYDPSGYATTLDEPIPGWTAVTVSAGGAASPQSTTSPQEVAVVNAGVNGDTALRALRRVTNFTAANWSPPPDCYIIALGLAEMSSGPSLYVAPADFAAHLTGLVNVLRAGGADVVLCTPHVAPVAGGDDYAAAVRATAALSGCGLVDLRALWQDHYDPAAPNDGYGTWLDTTAGNHTSPTDAGHQAIGDEVYQVFDPAGALPIVDNDGTPGAPRWERIRLLNTSSLLQYSGAWTANADAALTPLLASPREMRTTTPGARITFSVRCGEIYMLCRRWRDGGRVTVTVDGATLSTIDLYRGLPASTIDVATADGAIAPQDRVPLALGLADTVHTVTLTLAATSNPSSQGMLWRFDALELVRLRDGNTVEGLEPLQRLQRGTVTVALTNAPAGTATITFPQPYPGAPPIVVAQSPDPAYYTAVSGISGTSATITLAQYAHTPVTDTQTISWLAFG